MDAPALTPEQSRELEALRRRAYGPQSDIASDAAALARLRELESAQRTLVEVPAAAVPVPAATRPGAGIDEGQPEGSAGALGDGSPRDEADAARAASPAASTDRPSWFRRVPTVGWIAVALTVIVVATIVWGVGRLTEARSDFTLRPTTDAAMALPEEFMQQGFTGYYEIEPDSFQPYESFRTLSVWSATSAGGAECLVVRTEQFRFNSRVSCTPAGLDPTIDYDIWPGLPPEVVQGLPQGSVIRFVFRDGDVHVWVRAADTASPD